MISEEVARYLIVRGQAWVQAQRDFHRSSGRALTDSERAALIPFFSSQIIDRARIRHVPIIENPGFYAELANRGVAPPLDFTQMEGVTFIDTILISEKRHPHHPPRLPLIFHELVHVVQYTVLGLDEFVERYVWGWAAADRVYDKIPLERHAYALQERYERDPNQGFEVETVVKHFLAYV